MRTLALLTLLATSFAARAAETLPAGAAVTSLAVTPAAVALDSPREYAQLLVTATLSTGDAVDVTRLAEISAPDLVTLSPTGRVRPARDGSGSLTVTLGDKSVEVPVRVADSAAEPPVSFVRDVQPAFARMGCNQGTCHGSAQGKSGFKLSLRGYDPVYDYRALIDDLEGRRFNRAAPERSLMLLKPSGGVPHVGGVTMSPGEPYYDLVRDWIAQGLPLDLDAPRVKSIRVVPSAVVVPLPGGRQQFAVIATYADGTTRDVSAEAFIESNNTEVATVDRDGIMTTLRRGEATLLARYDGAYAAANAIVMGDRSGFDWKQLPVHNKIDELVDAKLRRLKIVPSEVCDDPTFLRRVTLDLTGLPPTVEAIRAFEADTRTTREKRAAAVDALLDSPDYVEHWANRWADYLQVNRKFLGEAGAKSLRDWVQKSVRDNTPYDEMARAVLTGSGSNLDDPGAAYYKVLRTPDAVMENTTQLFLAVRFNCNKCHDHPFERWTQDQYMQLSAFFAQVDRAEDPKFKGQKLGGTAVEQPIPLVEQVRDKADGEFIHERTGQTAAPAFPFDHAGTVPADAPRRARLAAWLTSGENPYFARSYANRVWGHLTGVGIIEPVDDIRAGNPPSNPELLDHLTATFMESGFDTKALIRHVCQSRTYQLSIAANDFNRDDETNYSRRVPKRLPAEVLFDAIARATGTVSELPGLPPGSRAAQLVDSAVDLPGGFLELFGKPVRESACDCERSNSMMLGPVLAMVNGPTVARAVKSPEGRLNRLAADAKRTDDEVVTEITLSVLNRKPTDAELALGREALGGASADRDRLVAARETAEAAFAAHMAKLPEKQAEWERGQLGKRPTAWHAVTAPRVTTREKATAAVDPTGAVLLAGTNPDKDHTVVEFDHDGPPITGFKLEALPDDSLPAKGPGRAGNGNFVLSEFRVTHRPAAKPDARPKPVKLKDAQADFAQGGFDIRRAIDGDVNTGWAVAPEFGKPHAATFAVAGSPTPAESRVTVRLIHNFGSQHALGKFRLSVTADPDPRLTSPVPPDLIAVLEVPEADRTPEQQRKLAETYLAQDKDYHALKAAIGDPVPPPRVLGAQDYTWALLNSPAFLFNY